MKKKYYIFTAVASYLLFLVVSIPAKPVAELLTDNSPVTLRGISGSLWNGNAYAVSINNAVQLKNTEWSFNLWKLFIGQLALDVTSQYSDNDVDAEIGVSFLGNYFVNRLTTKINAEDAAKLADIPMAQLSGMISLNIDHAHWKQGYPPAASGQITWSNATVTVTDTVSLGNVLITLGESEQQLLNAEIKNQGGDITITGTAGLVPEAGYIANIRLTPTASTGGNIAQSLAMFAKKQKNGDYLFSQSGKLSDIGLM
ncbi:MAG: type II secretion system protein N [Gammaproteobacteria bacterium]|nr:type II secretion system protein N [Gammaproteobacteria bacterium]